MTGLKAMHWIASVSLAHKQAAWYFTTTHDV